MPVATIVRHALGVMLLAVASCAWADKPDATPGHGPLQQTSTWFTDADGRVVVLHGVALTFPQYAPEDAPDTVPFEGKVDFYKQAKRYRDDAKFLADEGFNIVRVAMFPSGLMPQPGVFSDSYLDEYQKLVNTLTDAGLHVVIDFHQDLYANKYYGRGLPNWMGVDNDIPNAPDQGFPANYFVNVAMWRAYDNFFANAAGPEGKPLQEYYADAWRHVAQRFRDNPLVLGYEFMNEPFPGTPWTTCASPSGCPAFDQQLLTAFSRRMAQAIRQVDTEKTVFYEPNVTFDFGARTWHGDIEDDNAAFSFHIYCLALQFGGDPNDPFMQGCRDVGERPQFGYAREHAEQFQVATLLSEFGYFSGSPEADSTAVIRRNTEMADEHGFNWTYWHYTGVSSDGIVKNPDLPPEGDNLKEDRLNEIVRSYPRVIAGTPVGWQFDAQTKVFELEFSTRRVDGNGSFEAGAITEIFLPRRHYPQGYDITGSNFVVLDSKDPQLLHLAAVENAERVILRVAPPGNPPALTGPPDPGMAPYVDPPFADECETLDYGEGEAPESSAGSRDPLCVRYQKRDITADNGGASAFLLAEPGRVSVAGGACRYWQRDFWRVQLSKGTPTVIGWDGSYWFDRGAGRAGAILRNFRIGGISARPGQVADLVEAGNPELAEEIRAYGDIGGSAYFGGGDPSCR